MNKEKINAIKDLVDTTMYDLIRVWADYKEGTINVGFYFLEPAKIIKIPVAELISRANSAKGFFKYLREKLTEGVKL